MTCTATKTDPAYLTSMVTDNGLAVYFSGSDPLLVPITSPMYDEIVERVAKGQLNNIFELVNLAARVKAHTKGRFRLVEKDGVDVVMLFNQAMPVALSELLLDFVDNKTPTDALERFWQNCCKNPSEASRQSLYSFIKANNMTLTDDGCFIGYRSVRTNFTDHHTGRFDNSVGATVKMERKDVDSNANNTCSSGLHVAAWDYAWNAFGGRNGVTIEVKVNPKDVVTVPPDYNEQKMRVCEFKVLRQVTAENTSLLHPDTFVDQEVEDSGEVEVKGEADISADKYNLTVCTNGGVNIPAALAKAWGVKEGDTVWYCYNEYDDEVQVLKNCCGLNDDCFARRVDKHNSIRLGSKVFYEWCLQAGDYVEAIIDGDKIVLYPA